MTSAVDIALPPTICKCGKPKGLVLTVIGVPAKKATKEKLLPFMKLQTSLKEKGSLSFSLSRSLHVDLDVIEQITHNIPLSLPSALSVV